MNRIPVYHTRISSEETAKRYKPDIDKATEWLKIIFKKDKNDKEEKESKDE